MRRGGFVARPLVALTVAAALLGGGCARAPEPVHVTSIRVADGALGPALREAGLDAKALEGAARGALTAAGFVLGEGSRPHRALLDVASARMDLRGPQGPRVEVTVELVLGSAAPGQGAPRRESATADVPIGRMPSRRDAWLAAVIQASNLAGEALALSFAEEAKPAQALLADLGSPDPRVREQAIRIAGERRLREAVPALIARLDKEPARAAHRLVGALAQIGDERAVPALIDLARVSDPGLTKRIVRYVGDIGGEEAEGYLLTVASGHPDARVRAAAQEALADLATRAKPARAQAAAR